MINQLVNQRYEVVEKVGDSPLFVVNKAQDRANNRMVALKSLRLPYAEDIKFVDSLDASLASITDLRHPNIAQFCEFSRSSVKPYVVFEYADGVDLKERISRIAPFALAVAVDYACAFCEAIYFAHDCGYVHGDIRPQNIIISSQGDVKIINFGIHAALAATKMIPPELLLAAAPYQAPELASQQPGTRSGDIYAIGSILYEMLTRRAVYTGDSIDAIAQQHQYSAIPSPRSLNSGIPRAIEGIIIKCLQKRAEDRYSSASEMLNDLKLVRDALRFGKPLSWTPIDLDNPATTAAPSRIVVMPPPVEAPKKKIPIPKPEIVKIEEQEALSGEEEYIQPITVSSKNKLRKRDMNWGFLVKVAFGTVFVIILSCIFGFAAIIMSKWIVPKQIYLPKLVGQNIENVREFARKQDLTLKEHSDFTDKPRFMVYKTFPTDGQQLPNNRVLNVWFSKGTVYVDVPDVVGLSRDEADKKLRNAGLVVGKIMPEYTLSVPLGLVSSQDVSSKKRVIHDTIVDLTLSAGPKPDDVPDDTTNVTNSAGSGGFRGDHADPNPMDTGHSNDPPQQTGAVVPETHTFNQSLTITNDHLGARQVRVEYSDAEGAHSPFIDEIHNEGDSIPLKIEFKGKKMRFAVYYDDRKKSEWIYDADKNKYTSIDINKVNKGKTQP